VGSISGRGEFPPLVKKTLSSASCPKHCGARPNSQGDGPPCTGGAGVRGFSWPAVRMSFYLSNNAVGAVLPPAGQVFFRSPALVLRRQPTDHLGRVWFVAVPSLAHIYHQDWAGTGSSHATPHYLVASIYPATMNTYHIWLPAYDVNTDHFLAAIACPRTSRAWLSRNRVHGRFSRCRRWG